MAKISDSVSGTVLVHSEAGPVFLNAGDEVPAGAEIDQSLVEEVSSGSRGAKRRTKADS